MIFNNQNQMIFNSKLVEECTNNINDGIQVKKFLNPWLKGEVGVRRSGVVFKMTPEEQEEYIACALDIHYFTEKYCKVKTEDGSIGSIRLRNYQEEILDNFVNNRFNILMASRQVGKCFSPTTKIQCIINNHSINLPIYKLFFKKNKNKTIYDYIKYILYYTISKTETSNILISCFINHISYKLIKNIEKIEYMNIQLDENNISKKILKNIILDNIKVKTDTGFKEASNIYLTQPYKYYMVETKEFSLKCADNHILFNDKYEEIFVKDLKKGDFILTENGIQKITNLKKLTYKTSMFDITINDKNHRFYSNGILSHNTISSAIFMLHSILFNNDKNVMIVANKGDTAIEIMDKLKSIYTLLPFFLKPGVKVWNQKSLTFDNGCRIKSATRTKTPAIGFTIDILYLDEFAHIPSNIIEPYYKAVFPTVSAVKNSKIIITSTPNGMNLFHKLLTDAERLDGDPQKNNYKATRVYWYQVPGRFVTYVILNEHRLYEHGITKEYVYDLINAKFGDITNIEMIWNLDKQKYIINIFNNDLCSDEEIKKFRLLDSKGNDIPLVSISEISTWKEEAIKDIGGEDSFNQEYGLRFINASKSLLNESIIEDLLKNKKKYVYKNIDIFSDKLKFSYDNLKWVDDESIFIHENRKNYKYVLSVDISEGLGLDYSVINIFRVNIKPIELIEKQKNNYKSIIDFFKLTQLGIYRSNIISIKQLAEILYVLAFEYLNPDELTIVLELNNYGNTLLAEMPHVMNGNNNYGSYIFQKYKHRIDSTEEKTGLKLTGTKNILVKDYQDLMLSKSYDINNEETINEITTFVKQTTSAGNIKYAADVGNDDCVMTVVNSTSIFDKNRFKQMCEDFLESLDSDVINYINNCMNNSDYIETIDYSQLLKIRRDYMTYNNNLRFNNPFNRH